MAEKKNIQIELIETNKGQIEGVPANPRVIKDKKFKKLVKSIEENPEMLDLREILVFPLGDKFIVIGGNMRLEAVKKLGYKDVPCKVLPVETPAENLRAYILRDNASYGEWDFDELANCWDIDELEMADIDLPSGFGLEEENETSEDDFCESETKTRVQLGEIWQLGNHRLMCGDSTKIENVKKLVGGVEIDMLLTDPPYNVDYAKKNKYLNEVYGKHRNEKDIANDTMNKEEFGVFLTNAFSCASEVLKKGGVFYIWYSFKSAKEFLNACEKTDLSVRQNLIWTKNNIVLGLQDYQSKHEPCLYGWKDGASHYFIDDRTKTTLLEFKKPQKSNEHPTMKPIDLMGECIKNSSRKNENVLDLFGGSGSTLIACEQLERNCFTMELDPHYCDVILSRWEKLTGKVALKIE